MGLFGERWPYTNNHDLNLDWIISVIKYLKDNLPEEFENLENEIKLKMPKAVNVGNVGDILTSLGDGKSEWKSIDIAITDTIISTVNSWLNNHPEATTTVQDGAITPAKFNTELYNYYKEMGLVQLFIPPILNSTSQGNCSLMVTPNKTILFDTHASVNNDAIINYLTELFNAGIFTNIDYIILSHYHYDHVENLETILTAFPHVNCKLYTALSPSGYYPASQAPGLVSNYNNVIRVANDFNVEVNEVTADVTLTIDNLVKIELFNSNVNNYQYYSNNQYAYNNYSMVALVKIGKAYAMFPGDIERYGQMKVCSERELPRVNFYLVHHHGVQTDDYIPYIMAINPEYSIIPNDYSVAINQSLAGIFQKLVKSHIGASGYSNYSFVFNNAGCSITEGIEITNSGSHSATAVFYVDNSYSGIVHDGSFDHPFTKITEAFSFMKTDALGLIYELNIFGTDTPYNGFNLRNINVPITIKAFSNNNKPTIISGNIENVKNLTLSNLIFKGAGLQNVPDTGSYATMRIMNSFVTFGYCEIDGSLNNGNSIGLALCASTIRFNACVFSNYMKVFERIVIDTFTVVQMSGNTIFNNISNYVGAVQSIKYCFYPNCQFNNVTKILQVSNRPIPPVFDSSLMTPSIASLCDVTSEPGYMNSTHPVVIISHNKLYDILTGEEITQ